MPLMCEESLMIQPPESLQTWIEYDGQAGLFFGRQAWTELSRLLWEDRVRVAEAVAAETARPLLIDLAGLKAERDEALKIASRRGIWRIVAIVGISVAVAEGFLLLLD